MSVNSISYSTEVNISGFRNWLPLWNLSGQSHSNTPHTATCSFQPGLLNPSLQFPLNSHKMMPLTEMPLTSEPRLIALLYLRAPHYARRVWEDGSLQRGCSQRSRCCAEWTQEGCLLLLLLTEPQSTDKRQHKRSLLQITKFGKDWLKPVSSQKLLIYLYRIWNSALQPSWRKPKASEKYLASARVTLVLPETMTHWAMISRAEQGLCWLEYGGGHFKEKKVLQEIMWIMQQGVVNNQWFFFSSS